MLTNTQVMRLLKVSENNSSTNVKLSKIQLQEIGPSGQFLVRILRSLLKTGLSLIGKVLKPLAQSALKPLGLAAKIIVFIEEIIYLK